VLKGVSQRTVSSLSEHFCASRDSNIFVPVALATQRNSRGFLETTVWLQGDEADMFMRWFWKGQSWRRAFANVSSVRGASRLSGGTLNANHCARCGRLMTLTKGSMKRSDFVTRTQGCYQCRGCGRLTCYDRSNDRKPCVSGVKEWTPRFYWTS